MENSRPIVPADALWFIAVWVIGPQASALLEDSKKIKHNSPRREERNSNLGIALSPFA